MSDPELSDPEGEGEEVLTEDTLTRWNKKQLQDWLVKHHQRKSGNKPVLISRILRCLNFGSDDSGSEDSSDSDSDSCEVPPYQRVSQTGRS